MNVRIYSVHIEGFTQEEGWAGWDVVNVALMDDAHAAPEAMAQGLESSRQATQGELSEGKKPTALRVHEVRFIAEGQTA